MTSKKNDELWKRQVRLKWNLLISSLPFLSKPLHIGNSKLDSLSQGSIKFVESGWIYYFLTFLKYHKKQTITVKLLQPFFAEMALLSSHDYDTTAGRYVSFKVITSSHEILILNSSTLKDEKLSRLWSHLVALNAGLWVGNPAP